MKKTKKKQIKIGKLELSENTFELIILGILVFTYILSPRCYSITTGLYNKGTEEDQKNVVTAMGNENTENRFKLYFQWYNVIHELGHGLLYYNNGVNIDVADEEQLVNDFAVAYWKYYGEEEKVLTKNVLTIHFLTLMITDGFNLVQLNIHLKPIKI